MVGLCWGVVAWVLVRAQGVGSLALVPTRVLVIGGSGRVGASTVTELVRAAERSGVVVETVVGGRSRAAFDRAARRSAAVGRSSFVKCDITDAASVDAALDGVDVVVHTAGPFQQKRTPEVLDAALRKGGVDYVDVCDETFLCELVKTDAYVEAARARDVSAIVSAGIWPGVSALMAQLATEALGADSASSSSSEKSSSQSKVDFSFFTAGTGNAGPTIVSATFLLLCTPAVCFEAGEAVEKVPWSDARTVDFGARCGHCRVRLLDCPDVTTVARALKISNVTSRFATAPELWNILFGAAQCLVPAAILGDRRLMQNLALFSEPIVRAVDALVGAANVMRVDATDGQNKTRVTVVHGHEDLEKAVGIATAAFALELVHGRVAPGIHWPADLPAANRDAIIETLLDAPGTFEWSTTRSTQEE